MADLHAESKRPSSASTLILITVILLAIIYLLAKGCTNSDEHDATVAEHGAPAASSSHGEVATTTSWTDIDFNAPAATFEEVTDSNINVRGNGNYAIYGLGENILFDEGKSSIRADAEQNLKQVTGSIGKRFHGASVRIYGYTDAVGSAGYNKQLAEQRAEAVREWIVKNGNIAQTNISIQPVGEARPVASNATDAGRQQNRRVEIVARGAEGGQEAEH